jgi:uncharacterized protein (TIGR02996 family)
MTIDLLRALHFHATDDTAWLALADWLEEQADARAELVRLTLHLRHDSPGPRRQLREVRLRELLASGLQPCVPTLVNSIGMELVLVPPGRFQMGTPFSEPYHSPDEGPTHEVVITRPFYLGRFPVLQAEYECVTKRNPSHFAPAGPLPYYRLENTDTTRFPVDCVDFTEAVVFCQMLSLLPVERSAGRVYRLPSEAEWEYACRAGTSSVFSCGDSLSSRQGNFDGNYPYGGAAHDISLKRTCLVGQYPPNAFGLFDMHGNVWEWCSDWFDEDYYARSPQTDPPGPVEGEAHVLRGGSWIDAGWHCRSGDRSHREALHYVGFRVAMSADSCQEGRQ